jgi:pimeloyl-ACP methyl ester carboxylesterase
MLCLRDALTAIALVATAIAQSPYPVGSTFPIWPNTSGFGTPSLEVAIHYPAMTAGLDTPVVPRSNGWPVVVFLHGYDRLGHDYVVLGQRLAGAGLITVMLNTSRFDYLGLRDDALALPPALAAANAAVGSVLTGAFDLQRVGLAGHSMGGAVAGIVMATPGNGYRCGLTLSPVNPGLVFGPIVAQVAAPFGIVVGEGDQATPPTTMAMPYYQTLGTADGLKFLYVMNHECNHLNVAGLEATGNTAVFRRVVNLGIAFFRHFLAADTGALERCVGPTALAEPRLVALSQRIAAPQVWLAEPLRIGSRARLSVAAERGPGGMLAALALAPPTPTPIGNLLLDSGTTFTLATGVARRERRIDAIVDVPKNLALVGLGIAVQAFGASASSPLTFGAAIELVVLP